MPFNTTDKPIKNLPKNFSTKQKQVATSAANSALKDGKEEGAAIAIGISAGKKVNKSMDDVQKKTFIQVLKGLLNLVSDEDIDDNKIDEYLSKTAQQHPSNTSIELIKQFEEEEMIAIEPLYINIGKADSHGDGILDEELDKLIDNFNENIDNIQGNIHHQFMTDGFKPIKAYRLPMTVYVGDPSEPTEMAMIEKGQPVVEMQFLNKDYWEKRKSGILGGVSIGAEGKRVPNPDFKGKITHG